MVRLNSPGGPGAFGIRFESASAPRLTAYPVGIRSRIMEEKKGFRIRQYSGSHFPAGPVVAAEKLIGFLAV